ncbi:MAG: hypothetical protein R2909_15925 [Gemmatimonadales bacterium]
MTLVCLAASDWPTDPARAAELAAGALELAPRVRCEPEPGLLWADARDLDAAAIAEGLLALADRLPSGAQVGIASTPIAALVAARIAPDDPSRRITRIAPGEDRAFLAPLDVGVLEPPPPPNLYPLLAGVGIECCADLARLDRESVEARFGAEGARIWRLARADDDRPIFASRPRELPRAELEWVDYELATQEHVVFIVNSLLATVCDELGVRGLGGHAMTLEFALADRSVVRHPVRCSTPTADRRTWLRIVRAALELVSFDAPVVRIALEAGAAAPLADRQGDLFDSGFATARATEASLAHLLDKQSDALAVAERSAHPLPERRVRWRAVREPTVYDARRSPVGGLTDRSAPSLTLQLAEPPRPVEVQLAIRRDAEMPVQYREGFQRFLLVETMGPDRVSGGYGAERFDREYFQSIRRDGTVVLLFRDTADNRWFLGGWWD